MQVFKKIVSAIMLITLYYPIWLYITKVTDFMLASYPLEHYAATSGNSVNNCKDLLSFLKEIYILCVGVTGLVSIIHVLFRDKGNWVSHFRSIILRAISVFIDALIGSIPIWIGSFIGDGWGMLAISILGFCYIAIKIGFAAASLDGYIEFEKGNGFFYSIHEWVMGLNDFSHVIDQRKEQYNNYIKTSKF